MLGRNALEFEMCLRNKAYSCMKKAVMKRHLVQMNHVVNAPVIQQREGFVCE